MDISVGAFIAVLVLLATWTNRKAKYPVVAALLWMTAATVLTWAALVWRLTPRP